MKKLMVAAAIVCAAVASQAASVSWSSSFSATDKDGKVLQVAPTKPTISLVLLATGVDAADFASFEADWSKAVAVQDATWAVKQNTKTGNWTAKGSGEFFGDAKHTIAVGDVYGVMLNDGGKLSQLTYAGGALDSQMILVTKAGATDKTTFGNFATANYVVAASVPEPTSGLLLVLGLAGMALRRRRA